MFDYFVIVTGNSRRQLHAISDEIEHTLKEELKDKRMGIEGYNESKWILLDYGNVVIHLFDEETRDFYALEDFWSEASGAAAVGRGSAPRKHRTSGLRRKTSCRWHDTVHSSLALASCSLIPSP